MIKNKIVVFATEHYNTLGLIRSLGEAGYRPDYISIKGKTRVASLSKYIAKCYYTNSVEEGYLILQKEYENLKEKTIVLCMEDKVLGIMDNHYDEMKSKFIMYSAGSKGRILKYMDKYEILKLANKYGLKTLNTIVVDKGNIPNDIEYPIITKSISPTVGGWKSDVHICESEEDLKIAYENILSKKVIIQKYIDKKNEYCLDGISFNRGKNIFIPIESTYNYLIKGYYSPYMTVKKFNNQKIQKALEGMLKEIEFDGIYSVEFLIDKNNNYYFSEINFRHSTWSYAATVAGMNLPALWIDGMLNNKIPNKIDFVPFTAMVEPIDYQKRVVEREYDYREWLIDVFNCKCLYYYNKNDIEPFYEMIRNNEKLR